jgi:hypothetical protein
MSQPLTDEQAVRTAIAAIEGKAEIPPGVTPRVDRHGGQIVITFPTSHPVGVRGADFHAQVTLDEATGHVTQVLGGQ